MLGNSGPNGDFGGNSYSLDNMNLDRGDNGMSGGIYDPFNTSNVSIITLIIYNASYFKSIS